MCLSQRKNYSEFQDLQWGHFALPALTQGTTLYDFHVEKNKEKHVLLLKVLKVLIALQDYKSIISCRLYINPRGNQNRPHYCIQTALSKSPRTATHQIWWSVSVHNSSERRNDPQVIMGKARTRPPPTPGSWGRALSVTAGLLLGTSLHSLHYILDIFSSFLYYKYICKH